MAPNRRKLPVLPGPSQDSRKLSLVSSVAVVIGNMVGIGIFLTPAEVAKASPGIWAYLGIWLIGTLMAAAGAQVYAQLGTLFPKAGGDYRFLYEAYGPRPARAWGWLSIFGCFPGSIATLAVGITATLSQTSMGGALNNPIVSLGFIHVTPALLIGLALIWLSTAINVAGLSLSGKTQLLVTLIPILVFVVVGFTAAKGENTERAAQAAPAVFDFGKLTTAFCAVFFTYSGWNVITYLGSEIHRPKVNIPRVILLAMLATTGIFLILNMSFLSVIPLPDLAQTQNAGVAVATSLFGDIGQDVFGILLAMAIVAGLNATVMAGSRITMAMAQDGQLWTGLAKLSGPRQTPERALVFQAIISSLLVLSGSFSFLITVTGGVMIVLSCLTVSTVFVFKRKLCIRPSKRLPGYPWTGVLYLVTGGAISVLIAIDGFWWFLAGACIFVLLMFLDYLNPIRLIRRLRHT